MKKIYIMSALAVCLFSATACSDFLDREPDKIMTDDQIFGPETVKHRLEVYHKETEPLKDFYAERGLLRSVENQPSVEATTKAILNALRR